MSIWSDVAKAEVTRKGSYFIPGVYLARCQALKQFQSTQDGSDVIVGEFLTLESSCPDRPAGGTQAAVFKCPQGDGSVKRRINVANAKAMVSALADVNPKDIDEAGLRMAFSAEQPLTGSVVRVEAVNQKTKDGAGEFTKLSWWPATVGEKARAAQILAKLG